MKVKLSFDKHAIQLFLLDHVEKIVLGGIVLCGALILYRADFGGGYKNTPKGLSESAERAQKHWGETPTDEKSLGIAPAPDYVAMAERSKTPITEKFYALTQPWDRPETAEDVRRPRPPLLAVRDLTALPERASLVRTGGEASGGGARAIIGQRAVVLVGLVPIKEQIEAFRTAFATAGLHTERDYPEYVYAIVQRKQVTPDTDPKTVKFDPPDESNLGDEVSKLRVMVTRLKEFAPQPSMIPPQFIHARLTLPLPLRTDKPWPDDMYPESLMGPPFSLVKGNPAKYKDKKVTWVAADGKSRGPRVVYAHRVPTSGRDYGESEQFAVDFASAEQATQSSNLTTITGTVVGTAAIETVDIRGETRRREVPLLKFVDTQLDGDQPTVPVDNEDPLRGVMMGDVRGGVEGVIAPRRPGRPMVSEGEGMGYGRVPGTGATSPDFVLFRYMDFNVEPGASYVYCVRLVLANPNAGVERRHLRDPKQTDLKALVSPESETSEVVTIPRDTFYLVQQVVPTSRDSVAKMAVVRWLEENGNETFKKFSAARGVVLDTEGQWNAGGTPTRRPTRPAKAAPPSAADEGVIRPPPARGAHGRGHETELPAVGPSEVAGAAAPPPIDVKYITGAIVLDVRGGDRAANRGEPGEVLLLDGEGKLRVYSDLEGAPELRTREEAQQRAEQQPAGSRPGGALEGGLDFGA